MLDFPRLANDVFRLYQLILLARILLSWFPGVDRGHPAVVLLVRITEPYLAPFRRLLPPAAGFDISPIVAFFVLEILQGIVVQALGGL
jgi:YggT family protein